MATKITDLETPCLLLDRKKMEANIARVANRMRDLGGVLRPHVKTNKSIEVTRAIQAGGNTSGIMVSTLQEAEYFFENGITDIMYGVGIAPNKLERAAALIGRGCDLKVIVDNLDLARQLAAAAAETGMHFKVLIELDTDGHRSGVKPRSDDLLEIGDFLRDADGVELLGVLTHAGESYATRTPAALLAIARQERDLSVLAAERLRAEGHQCPVVSIGSTPTALAVDDLAGVTEVRAGVYVFFDLVMAGVGVCKPDDIAVSVLASVIGHQPEKGWAITDAGWMAMSRDRGTADMDVDYGYGMVADLSGTPRPENAVIRANQEHGVVGATSAAQGDVDFADYPVGGLLRVLPNHACATSAQHSHYHVVDGDEVVDTWSRGHGW